MLVSRVQAPCQVRSQLSVRVSQDGPLVHWRCEALVAPTRQSSDAAAESTAAIAVPPAAGAAGDTAGALLGAWQQQEVSGLETYLDAVGVSGLKKMAALRYKPSLVFSIGADGILQISQATPIGTKVENLPLDVKMDENSPNGGVFSKQTRWVGADPDAFDAFDGKVLLTTSVDTSGALPDTLTRRFINAQRQLVQETSQGAGVKFTRVFQRE